MSVMQVGASSRLSWLLAVWGEHRRRAIKLLERISDLGPLQAMKPAVFCKFLQLMDQVGEAKEEEIRLISAIDAIEKQHRFQREHHYLKQACPTTQKVITPVQETEEVCLHSRLLRWMALYLFFGNKKIYQKNHTLTVD